MTYALLFTGFSLSIARADERLFTYTYEADVLPKGGMEFEQWITHRHGKDDGTFSRWDLREELEYGLTPKLTTALYLNTTSTYSSNVKNHENRNRFEFDGISSEWKYQLLNPNEKPVGLLLYGEGRYSGTEAELEEKIVLQHNFGSKWTLALNGTVEQEWKFEDDSTQFEGAIELSGGLAYKINTHWSVGLEGRNHRVLADFQRQTADAWFMGPAIHYGRSAWWATLTVMPQITGHPETTSGLELDEHERIEARLIVGLNF